MSSSSEARLAAVFGALAVLAIPAAGAAAAFTTQVKLLDAVYVAVPAAFVLGLIAFSLYRRARAKLERSVHRRGQRSVRAARFLAFAGLYLAMTGALALGFYALLHVASSSG
jgi:hypothetical protein